MRNRIFTRSFNLVGVTLLLTILVVSCTKDTVQDPNVSYCKYDFEHFEVIADASFSQVGILPLHMNNYWRYTDSTWDESGVLSDAGEFTILPLEVGKHDNEVWWRFNFYPIDFIHQTGDSILNLQGYLGTCPENNTVYALFDGDSLTTYTGIWDDVATSVHATKIDSVETAAGTFVDCIEYYKQGYDNTVLKPGMGILEWKSGFENNSLAGRKLSLIEYHLE